MELNNEGSLKMKKQYRKAGIYLAIVGLLFMLFSGCRDKVKFVSRDTNLEFEPAYLKLHRTGELKKRGEELWNIMKSCRLCPRQCGANRLAGEKGFCQASKEIDYIKIIFACF